VYCNDKTKNYLLSVTAYAHYFFLTLSDDIINDRQTVWRHITCYVTPIKRGGQGTGGEEREGRGVKGRGEGRVGDGRAGKGRGDVAYSFQGGMDAPGEEGITA
jgi:hypothetical protein